MNRTATKRLPWLITALTVSLAVAALVLATISYREPSGQSDHSLWFIVILAAILLPWSIIGALVASRRPKNPIGWLFVFAALGMSVSALSNAYAEYSVLVRPLPATEWMAWLPTWLWNTSAIVAPLVLLLIFPDGRFLSPRWRLVTILILLAAAIDFVAEALAPGPIAAISEFPTVENPIGIESSVRSAIAWAGENLLATFAMLFVIASLVTRLRRSVGEERAQIKWVIYAGALTFGSFLVAFTTDSAIGFFLALGGLAAIPIAAGLAILRYRLFEIDRVINRTVVYALLTAGLAGLYFGIVIALQQIFGGLTRGNDLAIAGSTLAVAALFRPARRRIQELVDRRFYRHRYDAQQTLEAFSTRLRDEVDLDQLGAELGAVVHETMQPSHISLWLRSHQAER